MRTRISSVPSHCSKTPKGPNHTSRAQSVLTRIGRELLYFVSPASCHACDCRLEHRTQIQLCYRCTLALEDHWYPQCSRCALPDTSSTHSHCINEGDGFDMLLSRCLDQTTGASLLRAVKDRQNIEALSTVAELMLQDTRALEALRTTDAIIAVPSSYPNRVKRGCDVPAKLATYLARKTGTPILRDGFQRRSWRSQRTIRTRGSRQQHKLGFTLSGLKVPKTVALIDDLAVTTSTLSQAAHVLRDAGAQHIWCWTFGRRVHTKTTEALTKE